MEVPTLTEGLPFPWHQRDIERTNIVNLPARGPVKSNRSITFQKNDPVRANHGPVFAKKHAVPLRNGPVN
jgi:hypothetical protein